MNRILIADDEPVERLVLEKRIRKNFGEEITVFQAENGLEAVELQQREHCPVLVLDISMPEKNGLEAAEEIRKTDPQAVIIFLTAYDDFAYTRKAIRVKALDYLLKPCEESELVSVLEEAFYQADQRAEQEQPALPGGNAAPGPSAETPQSVNQQSENRKSENQQSENSQSGELDRKMEAFGNPDFIGTASANPAGPRMQQIARLIRDFVESHYSEEISMQDAAREFGYSEAYFCKLFKQCFDQNFTLYLASIRVREARRLLEDPLINVRDVSRKVGYFDSNYFAKVFKRLTGMNPSEYRDRQYAQK